MEKRDILLAGGCVASFGAGFFVGYKGLERKLQFKYDALLKDELERTKEFYKRVNKTDEFATPEEAVSELVGEASDALRVYQGQILDDHVRNEQAAMDRQVMMGDEVPITTVEVVETVTTEEPVEPTEHNVWDDHPVYPPEMEVELRSPTRPYVLTMDEFLANEMEHDQVELTYYAGDNVLVDSMDKPVDDVDYVMGEHNLLKFGVGSTADHVVLVRNEKLKMDLEISKSDGKYAHEVLGLEHSDGGFQRTQRPRRGDDG